METCWYSKKRKYKTQKPAKSGKERELKQIIPGQMDLTQSQKDNSYIRGQMKKNQNKWKKQKQKKIYLDVNLSNFLYTDLY